MAGNGPPNPGKWSDKDFRRYVVASLVSLHAKIDTLQKALLTLIPEEKHQLLDQQKSLRDVHKQSLLATEELVKQIKDGSRV